jgi:hypothetical protein
MAFPGERKDSWQQKKLIDLMSGMTSDQKAQVIASTFVMTRHLFDDPRVRTNMALNIALGISEESKNPQYPIVLVKR